MPTINFQKQFAGAVFTGEKPHTIRALRKRPFRMGDRLCLYTGLRTKSCVKLGEATAKLCLYIEINAEMRSVELGDQMLKPHQIETLSTADGFQSVDDFFAFFSSQLDFVGQLIWWEKITHHDCSYSTRETLPLWEFWEYSRLWEWLQDKPEYSSLIEVLKTCDRQTHQNDERIWAIAKEQGIQLKVAQLIDLIPF